MCILKRYVYLKDVIFTIIIDKADYLLNNKMQLRI